MNGPDREPAVLVLEDGYVQVGRAYAARGRTVGEIVFSTGKGCLGRYGKVRVSVTTKGGGETDHSPARHRFHSRVPRF